MKSRIFATDAYREIEAATQDLLNVQRDFLSPRTLESTRAAGDAIQDILAQEFGSILGGWASDYSADFARRAMADLAFTDVDGNYYVIDVKTHRTSTRFNMPNLTSVERLARFYEDDANYFVLLLVSYDLNGAEVSFTGVRFLPIEFLDWDCLNIGALGWGQIQITNSNRIVVNPHASRKQWMLDLCDTMFDFYPKEIAKISERIHRFEEVRAFWANKPDA